VAQTSKAALLIRQGKTLFSVGMIQFRRQNGSLHLFVHLPWLTNAQGILRTLCFEPGVFEKTFDFTTEGVTTSELLKYSHHADGNVHFNQDGRGMNIVGVTGPALDLYSGHLFTIDFYGLEIFQRNLPRNSPKIDSKRSSLVIGDVATSLDPMSASGRIVGSWHRGEVVDLPSLSLVAAANNPVYWRTDDGQIRIGQVIESPDRRIAEGCLTLSWYPLDFHPDRDAASVALIGGISNDPGAEGQAIMIRYYQQRDDFDELVTRLGSVDYRPGSTTTE
jgi:hypothetical protein